MYERIKSYERAHSGAFNQVNKYKPPMKKEHCESTDHKKDCKELTKCFECNSTGHI